jgi:hypothetical protein
VYASGNQTQPMFRLMQRSLFISQLRQNDEAAAHSLPRGDSVLTSAHIPIHNLLHSPTMPARLRIWVALSACLFLAEI